MSHNIDTERLIEICIYIYIYLYKSKYWNRELAGIVVEMTVCEYKTYLTSAQFARFRCLLRLLSPWGLGVSSTIAAVVATRSVGQSGSFIVRVGLQQVLSTRHINGARCTGELQLVGNFARAVLLSGIWIGCTG